MKKDGGVRDRTTSRRSLLAEAEETLGVLGWNAGAVADNESDRWEVLDGEVETVGLGGLVSAVLAISLGPAESITPASEWDEGGWPLSIVGEGDGLAGGTSISGWA